LYVKVDTIGVHSKFPVVEFLSSAISKLSLAMAEGQSSFV